MNDAISRRNLIQLAAVGAAAAANEANASTLISATRAPPKRGTMLKTMGFSRAKPGLTLDEFRTHYETVHAPLAVQLFPMIRRYERNYVRFGQARMPSGLEPKDFGWTCITEMWFDDEAGYAAFNEALRDPSIRRRMQDDEAKFVASNSVWKLIVDEVFSDLADVPGA
jgi:uncharacterized protein (TIGR02118 family)